MIKKKYLYLPILVFIFPLVMNANGDYKSKLNIQIDQVRIKTDSSSIFYNLTLNKTVIYGALILPSTNMKRETILKNKTIPQILNQYNLMNNNKYKIVYNEKIVNVIPKNDEKAKVLEIRIDNFSYNTNLSSLEDKLMIDLWKGHKIKILKLSLAHSGGGAANYKCSINLSNKTVLEILNEISIRTGVSWSLTWNNKLQLYVLRFDGPVVNY